jgi:hypothetical protein
VRRKIGIWALIGAILLGLSCDGPSGPSIPPAPITDDNSGGVIAFYQTWRMSDDHSLVEFYAQRISSEGDFLWGEKGMLIASGDAAFYWTGDLYVVGDGSGGAFVIWGEFPSEPPYSQTHVARIGFAGNVEWQRDIAGAKQAIEETVPDGSGGAIIGYLDQGDGNMSILKIDSEGNFPWGVDAVPLNLGDCDRSDIASDNLGGAIVVRHLGDNTSAQRVDSGGNTLWGTGGVQVCVSPAEQAQAVSDGAGGAVIAYIRDIPCGDGKQGSCDLDIYAQRIDAAGNVLWGLDGVPICVGPSHPYGPQIVADGAGGAVISFADERAVWAQRLDTEGHKLWPEDVEVWKAAYHFLASDGFGGGISVQYGGGGITAAAQRLDATGRELWGTNGTVLTSQSLELLSAVSDGSGGVLISWPAVEFTGDAVSRVSYYVQRIDAEGDLPWGDEGILLNS